jgi:hypothetical protein
MCNRAQIYKFILDLYNCELLFRIVKNLFTSGILYKGNCYTVNLAEANYAYNFSPSLL